MSGETAGPQVRAHCRGRGNPMQGTLILGGGGEQWFLEQRVSLLNSPLSHPPC